MLNGLDLFSGIGGLTLALSDWVRPIAYCENDRYAQSVLLSQMAVGNLPSAPIWDDIRTLNPNVLGPIEIIYGGFPCQDISTAGLGRGLEGERSGLVFEMLRLVKEIKPTFVFMENVPAIRARGAERVGKELASLGYDCRWDLLSAYDVGAPHKRERWFLLAYAKGQGLETRGQGRGDETKDSEPPNSGWWATEPQVARVADGIPLRSHRIRCLGNAVVPEQAKEAFKRLMGLT
jgi:DNA (cytosine-5)-methyltransferase 1